MAQGIQRVSVENSLQVPLLSEAKWHKGRFIWERVAKLNALQWYTP